MLMAHKLLLADDSVTIQRVIALTFAEEYRHTYREDSGDPAGIAGAHGDELGVGASYDFTRRFTGFGQQQFVLRADPRIYPTAGDRLTTTAGGSYKLTDTLKVSAAESVRYSGDNATTGGIEHACMHLLYARFFWKAARDMGLVHGDEPFKRLFNQGMILGEDGEKMSKSRGNVIDPDKLVADLGADAVRVFLMFIGPWELGGPWNSRGMMTPEVVVARSRLSLTMPRISRMARLTADSMPLRLAAGRIPRPSSVRPS